jgi:hypothetical protein
MQYFNLTAQKDSQATARLTRSATLLAKLIFFLPISFITAYFSIQIPDLTGSYTAKTYWGTFGVTCFISFLSLFFFSKMLVVISDSLDEASSKFSAYLVHKTGWFKRGHDGHVDEDDEDKYPILGDL